MRKDAFLETLNERLSDFPEADRRSALQYYEERIRHGIRSGLTEPEAVSAMGDMDSIVEKVADALKSGRNIADETKSRSVNRAMLLILGSPLWFLSIVLGICAWFALMVVLWFIVLMAWFLIAAGGFLASVPLYAAVAVSLIPFLRKGRSAQALTRAAKAWPGLLARAMEAVASWAWRAGKASFIFYKRHFIDRQLF